MTTQTAPDPAGVRRALIVVDVQNDFCEGGSLAVAGGAQAAADIAALLDTDHDYAVVAATADWHIRPDGHFAADGQQPDFNDTWPVHCMADTDGAAIHPALVGTLDRQRIPVFRKGQYTASYTGFDGRAKTWPAATLPDDWDGGTLRTLGQWLQVHDIAAVDVVGLAFDFCVKATALDAAAAGFDVTVVKALTAAVSPATETSATAELTAAGVTIADTPAAA